MVRILNREVMLDDVHYVEIAGLSTDSPKPTGFATGSVFFEVDTGDAYFYDEESGTWIKAGGGGDE